MQGSEAGRVGALQAVTKAAVGTQQVREVAMAEVGVKR